MKARVSAVANDVIEVSSLDESDFIIGGYVTVSLATPMGEIRFDRWTGAVPHVGDRFDLTLKPVES